MVSAFNFCVAYVIVDFLCLVLTVIISSNVSRDSGSETQVRYFFLLLTANLLFDVFDAVWAILVFGQVFEPSDVLLSVVNGINVCSVAFAGCFWFSFSLTYFESSITNSKPFRFLATLPAAFSIVLHVIGYYTNQNVIFMPDGTVTYGIAHTIIVIVPLLYLLGATGVALNRFRDAKTQSERRMCLVFIMFMIAPAASGVFDIFVPDMPVAAAGMMISIAYVFTVMQESRIFSDALTGLNNRRRAESFLEDGISHASVEHPLYLFIIDMDQFKDINDTYGHLEGDHALQLMANVLRSVSAQVNAFAARWGGDEFVLISSKSTAYTPEQVADMIQEALVDKARENHVPYHLACSVGFAKCDSISENSAHLVADADEMLYHNKQVQH